MRGQISQMNQMGPMQMPMYSHQWPQLFLPNSNLDANMKPNSSMPSFPLVPSQLLANYDLSNVTADDRRSKAAKSASVNLPVQVPLVLNFVHLVDWFHLDACFCIQATFVLPVGGRVVTRTYACDRAGCGEKFSTRFSLHRHLKKHSGDRPFKCAHSGISNGPTVLSLFICVTCGSTST